MPRPKKAGGPEPKTRSRTGCWPCKARKIKCGEEKPKCLNCERQGEICDYSIRLNWGGRTKMKGSDTAQELVFSNESSGARSQDGTTPHTTSGYASGTAIETTPSKPQSPESHSPLEGYRAYAQQQARNDVLSKPDAYSMKVRPRSPVLQTEHAPVPLLPATSGTSMIDPVLIRTRNANTDQKDESSRHLGMHVRPSGDVKDLHPPPLLRDRTNGVAYPSPAESGVDSPPSSLNPTGSNLGGPNLFLPNPQMPPPFQSLPSWSYSSNPRKKHEDVPLQVEHKSKRIRLSPSLDYYEGLQPSQATFQTNNFTGGSSRSMASHTSPYTAIQQNPHSPLHTYTNISLTPTTSSVASDDSHARLGPRPSTQLLLESPDLRRLSVKSLLSDDSTANSPNESAILTSPYATPSASSPIVSYGLDRGFPDLDLPNNNDSIALSSSTPAVVDPQNSEVEGAVDDNYFPAEFGFGIHGANHASGHGSYYAKPVLVTIPRSLGALPATLQDNPMNLLYFHHFLNHTARILVPHDCSENPFKSILPQMAVRDNNLLHLLLAYSASHRARLLKQPEPANRIALWVRNVFGTLRRALNDPTSQISNVNLATAIMLASLEIISPNTFDVPVPWQNHLNVARRMIVARGGAQSVHRKDKVSYFLSRWFAYLDVLGSLSGGKNDQPLYSGDYWANDDLDDEHDFQIDCLLGFTSRCVGILARIAELARQCDSERIDSSGNVSPEWGPSAQTIAAAESLKTDLQEARMHRYKGCPHRPRGNDPAEDGWDLLEMVATNEAFHWAGLIHLNRRVLGKPTSDVEVQIAVREIEGALFKVRRGGTAEACLLFPMFTAGCDAQQEGQRDRIMGRLRSVERSGMTQVHKARTLMEKVWETGRPWETLVSGEFFG